MTPEQPSLAFEMPESRPVPTDPAVLPEARPRLTRQAREIYEMLLDGAATEEDLRLATGSKRVAARIYDIKRWLAYEKADVRVRSAFGASGDCVYWLEQK